MPSEKIIQLQQALTARGLSVQLCSNQLEGEDVLLDLPFPGGALVRGELAELWAQGESSGGTLALVEIIQACAAKGQCLALVDGNDCFDPTGLPAGALQRLLWVRTHSADEAIRAADLLLRDGNLPLVLLQLRGLSVKELRKVPSQHWYRLQQLARQTGTSCLAITPRPLVPCARKRWLVVGTFALSDLELDLSELRSRLKVTVQHRQSSFGPAVQVG